MSFDLIPGKTLTLSSDYLAQTRARDFWRRSDRGRWDFADGFDARGNPVLPRHPREPGDRHTIRRSMAMLRRYMRPIIDRYNDHVFRQPVKRMQPDESSPYAAYMRDADGCGTPLPTLMRRALRLAQVEGQSYLLSDSNVQGVYQSSADDIAAGKRGITRIIQPDQVVMWRDWEGQITEAAIMFRDEDGKDYLWCVDRTVAYRVDITLTTAIESKSGTGSTRAVLIQVDVVGTPTPHNFGGCPLVRLCPTWESDGAIGDDSQGAPIAECQKRILNLDSMLWEELSGNTFTMPVFFGVSPEELKAGASGSELSVGPGMCLAIPSAQATYAKIGGDPAQAQSLRESLRSEIAELYRVSGLSPGNPLEAGSPESGVAKAFAFNEIEARLSALSEACEHAENLGVRRLSQAFQWGDIDPAAYPRTFDVPDLAGELDYTIRLVTAPNIPEVLRDKAWRNFASVSMTLSPEEQSELDEQLEAQAEQREQISASPFMGGQVEGDERTTKPGADAPGSKE